MAKAPQKSAAQTRTDLETEVDARITELRGEIAALTQTLRDYGLQGAAEAKAKARHVADDATTEALHAIKELRAQFDTLQGDVEGKVKTHPFAWLAGAVGLGVILGLFLSHRD